MLKKFKKYSIKSVLLTGVSVMIFTTVVFAFALCDMDLDYITTKNNLNTMYPYQLQDEAYVKAEIYAVVDCYATDDEGRYYIIPVGEEEYMSMYVYDKYVDEFEAVADATWDYLNGRTQEIEAETIKTVGITYRTGYLDDLYVWMTEWFQESQFLGTDDADEINEYIEPYVYVYVPYSMFYSFEYYGGQYFLIGICLIIYSCCIVCIIRAFTGGYQKGVKKFMINNGILMEALEQDMIGCMEAHKVAIGRKYMLCQVGAKTHLVKNRDIIWVYQHTLTTVHRTYGIKTGTTVTHSLYMYLRNKKHLQINMPNEAAVQEILRYVMEHSPNALVGFHNELASYAKNNYDQLIRLSDEKAASVGADTFYKDRF